MARVTVEEEIVSPNQSVVQRETELYEPFREWLQASYGTDLSFAHARITATPRGHRKRSGKWSRPDVTAIQVIRSEWLPEVALEVSTYEIKRHVDALKPESIYEAAAHGRWAHRASLVIEGITQESLTEEYLGTVERFGLGLYTIQQTSANDWSDIDEVMAPAPQNPEPVDLEDLLVHFFKAAPGLRGDYKAQISR